MYKIDNNINTEPSNVYKKKKYPARIFLSRDPQIPIIKNIGIRILSKKTGDTQTALRTLVYIGLSLPPWTLIMGMGVCSTLTSPQFQSYLNSSGLL